VNCAQEHVRVAQAIRVGDAETAAREVADHIHHVMAIVLTARPVSAEPGEAESNQ
jgi:DNA-binding FadR family transcriptional regulator